MDQVDNEISSILIESESIDEGEAQLSILSQEISSLSELTVEFVPQPVLATDKTQSDVKTLRDKLMENVNILQQELKLFEASSRKEGSSKKESVVADDMLEQLSGIKTKVDLMKLRLRTSEDLMVQRTQENEQLKLKLHDLEIKNFTREDRYTACKSCLLF